MNIGMLWGIGMRKESLNHICFEDGLDLINYLQPIRLISVGIGGNSSDQ